MTKEGFFCQVILKDDDSMPFLIEIERDLGNLTPNQLTIQSPQFEYRVEKLPFS
jgi:hypothetical protein